MYSVRHPARRYDREYIAYPISVFSLCVACSICRCGSGWKHGGFCFFSFPAVSMISCPNPPAPLPPPGKGESQSLFRRGLRPRHPCTESPTALANAAVQVPGGWFARQVAGLPCLELYLLPPSPLPPFPLRGRGSPTFYFAGGFAPGTPALNRLRHLLKLPCRCPVGGLPGRSPGRPALSFIGCPHPPSPPSRREGGF